MTLGNAAGTAPADFTVHYNGADHAVNVPAGTTTEFTVPVDEDTTSTLTVAATGLHDAERLVVARLLAHRAAGEPRHQPGRRFLHLVLHRHHRQLSNMKLDDTTTDAVTFTVTTPTGAQEQVLVIADQITKRSYASPKAPRAW